MEIWKDVVEFPGWYEVSNLGNVRSVTRIVNRTGGTALWKGRILKKRDHTGGYHIVNLSVEGSSQNRYVHRLVAEAFLDKSESPEVNHIDGDKQNNTVENLEWCSGVENVDHAIRTGLIKSSLYLVLDRDSNIVYDGFTISELKKLGFQQPAISRCLSGKLKTHKGFTFKIKESKQ